MRSSRARGERCNACKPGLLPGRRAPPARIVALHPRDRAIEFKWLAARVDTTGMADLAVTSQGGSMSKKFQATRLLLAVAAIVALAVELGAGHKF